MPVKFTSNHAKIIGDTEVNVSNAIRFLLQDVKRQSEPKTPKDTGDLRDSTIISVLGRKGMIQWQKEYAIYQEGKQFINYTTPGTGPHFAENAMKDALDNSEVYLRLARVIL